MESFGNPKSWAPYVNTDDCSQGFCSFHCPQWCYIPSHPPPPFSFPDDKSGPKFSPVIVSIIGILASAFLLVSYFAIISKFCGSTESSRTENRDPSEDLEDNHNPSNHEPWHAATTGLDEALIKLIAVHKFRKGDGVVEGSDCSVCLGEFEEEESLRLLPKCNHAFHVKCIDAWLKAHSNCPLCRANIVVVSSSSPPGTVTETETPLNNVASPERRSEIHGENATAAEDIETGGRGVEISEADVPKTPIRALRNAEAREERDIIIEVRDEENEHIRRWVSMDYSCRGCVPIGDVFQVNQSEDFEVEEFHIQGGSGSSKHRNRMLQGVTRPAAMKRSFSSGRFLFTKHGRGRNIFTPF